MTNQDNAHRHTLQDDLMAESPQLRSILPICAEIRVTYLMHFDKGEGLKQSYRKASSFPPCCALSVLGHLGSEWNDTWGSPWSC